MRSILLDESVPHGVVTLFGRDDFTVAHASDVGLSGLDDAVLLRAAVARGVDVFVTCDQNLVEQQNIKALPFGLVVICTNNWPTILGNGGLVAAECSVVTPGTHRKVLKGAHVTRYGRSPRRPDPAS